MSELKAKAMNIEATVRIGKNGLTEGTLNEIKRQLKNSKLVKVKLLKPFIADKDKKIIAKDIAEKTNSELVNVIGFVITLHKNKINESNINEKNN